MTEHNNTHHVRKETERVRERGVGLWAVGFQISLLYSTIIQPMWWDFLHSVKVSSQWIFSRQSRRYTQRYALLISYVLLNSVVLTITISHKSTSQLENQIHGLSLWCLTLSAKSSCTVFDAKFIQSTFKSLHTNDSNIFRTKIPFETDDRLLTVGPCKIKWSYISS